MLHYCNSATLCCCLNCQRIREVSRWCHVPLVYLDPVWLLCLSSVGYAVLICANLCKFMQGASPIPARHSSIPPASCIEAEYDKTQHGYICHRLPSTRGWLSPEVATLRKISSRIATRNANHTKISVVSIANSIQAYVSLAGTKEVYSGTPDAVSSSKPLPDGIPARTAKADSSPVTGLSARTFGTWTALSSIIRLYAAYHINDPLVYELALWTFGLAFGHFAIEWLVFGTARWGRGLAGPVLVSTGTGAWMLAQWSSYVA